MQIKGTLWYYHDSTNRSMKSLLGHNMVLGNWSVCVKNNSGEFYTYSNYPSSLLNSPWLYAILSLCLLQK